ncbi:MAG: LPS export ABC transporter permease LptG [Proteobacteria bacterium]|nr:LPS export ABC transporter permease LptG [Pseudomonadota bacterium]
MTRIGTLERYLGRQIYGAVGFVLAGFLALFAFFDLIRELKDLGNGAYQLREIFTVVLLWLPGHAYELLPVAVLIGTLYVLAHLSSNSEYTVMRASGLSPARAGLVLAKVGVAFVALTFAIGEWVAPTTEEMAQQTRMRAMSSLIGQGLQSGLWFKDERSFINVAQAPEANLLQGVRIYEFDAAYRLRIVSEAREAEYAGAGLWRLREVVQTRFEGPEARAGPVHAGLVTTRFAEAEWRSAVNPDLLSVLIVAPERMSAWKLYRYTRHLAGNKQKTERYEIALWKKLFYPFATLVMMALALPFAYLQSRSGMVGVKVFFGIMLGIVFHMLNSLFSHVGLLQQWPPVAAAAVPSMLFFATALLMMLWIERLRPMWVRFRG